MRPAPFSHTLRRSLLIAFLVASAAPAGADWQGYDLTAEGGTYALRYLPDAVDPEQPLPVVIFLHGSGASPFGWQPVLQPVAEEVGVALLVPASFDPIGFGVGADDVTIDAALERLRGEVLVDEERIGIAGHSAGGGYAVVLAYARRSRYAGVFVLATPYRTVLKVADPDYTAPLRMYYGTLDPNYQGSRQALEGQWQHLEVPYELVVGNQYGHNAWPPGTLEDGFRFLLGQRYRTAGGCVPDATTLCLVDGRYAVSATWEDFDGVTGDARVAGARTAVSGLLTFFDDSNWELQVKVLEACIVNQHVWVFAAGTTNVGFSLTVDDLRTGQTATYTNPVGQVATPILDIEAFSCTE